jgi:hypothetical protein
MPTRSVNLTDAEQKAILSGTLPDSLVSKVKTATKPRSSRYSKSKGMATQAEVAEFVSELLDIPFNNQDDQSEIKTRSAGLSGTDLILTGQAYKRFPFDVEVKAVETLSVPATIAQAQSNTAPNRHWLIFWKKKAFSKKVVIMDIQAFEWLWKRSNK